MTFYQLRPRSDARSNAEPDIIRVERSEFPEDSSFVLELRIHYHSGPLKRERRSMVLRAKFTQRTQEVDIVGGYFFVDPPSARGRGIGSLFLSQAIAWAKRIAPDASVSTIFRGLDRSSESESEADRAYREMADRLYESIGVRYVNGAFQPLMVRDLKDIDPARVIPCVPQPQPS